MNRLIGLIAVVSGKVLAQGALLAYGIVVARMAGPPEFGLYAAALSLVLILDACLGAPLDYTSVRFAGLHQGEPDRVLRLQSAIFRLKCVGGAALVIGGALFGRRVSDILLNGTNRPGLILAAAASTSALLLIRGVAAFLQSQSRFRAYSVLDAALGALRLIVAIGLALAGAVRAEWYLAGFGIAAVLLMVVSIGSVPQPYLRAGWPGRADRRAIVRFLGVTTAVIILGTLTGRSDLLFLGARASASDVADYAAAAQLASVATLVAGYASVTIQPGLIPAARGGRLGRVLLESLGLGGVLGAALLIMAWQGGAATLGALYGAPFSHASGLLRILVIGTALDLICMPVAMTYVLQVRPVLALWNELAAAAVYLAAAVPVAALGGAAMAMLVTGIRIEKAIFYIAITAREARRSTRGRVPALDAPIWSEPGSDSRVPEEGREISVRRAVE